MELTITQDTDFGEALRKAELAGEATFTAETDLLREQISNLLDLRNWNFVYHAESYEVYRKEGDTATIRLMADTIH